MTFLCRLADIGDDDARGFEFGEDSLVAVRRDGQVHVYVNWCPHLGIELNYQPDEFFDLDRRYLQCANHGALFDVDSGLCVLGPCKGNSLKKVESAVVDGVVIVVSVPARTR